MLLATLGTVAALAVTGARADPPADGRPVTVFRTVTEDRAYQGRGVRWWAARATQNARERNAARGTAETLGRRVRALQRRQSASWRPTVRYALALARAVYGVDLTRRAWCESRFDVYARNASGSSGLLQFLPSTWRTTPFGSFSVFDPVASALAGGWMVRAGRSGEWTCGL